MKITVPIDAIPAGYGYIDNLTKSIMDALTGVLWLDDSQVAELHVSKNLAGTPQIILDLEEV